MGLGNRVSSIPGTSQNVLMSQSFFNSGEPISPVPLPAYLVLLYVTGTVLNVGIPLLLQNKKHNTELAKTLLRTKKGKA